MGHIIGCRVIQYRSILVKPGAVAGAVPGVFLPVPVQRAANPETKLKQLRQRAGMSQSELAEQSGVPVRTIQQYEQRQKSINKAQAEYLMMLANALHCKAEDLIEPVE